MSSNTTNSNNNKKEKVISAKGDEAEEMVLAYLIQQNRPYGASKSSLFPVCSLTASSS